VWQHVATCVANCVAKWPLVVAKGVAKWPLVVAKGVAKWPLNKPNIILGGERFEAT